MSQLLNYKALIPKQSNTMSVCTFCAPAAEVLGFAQIDRLGRDSAGQLRGFQRPQIISHIKEIRNYLGLAEAVLPNSVVVAFTRGAILKPDSISGMGELVIDTGDSDGYVVDGQQRLSALQGLQKEFEVVVSAILCRDQEELRRQFILINNTKPLPKQLIYELLPSVDGLPPRLAARSTAAAMVERLNYDEASSLRGQIKQHTNPTGTLQDTVLQRMVMNSLSDGILREYSNEPEGLDRGFHLISNFFAAVQTVFPNAWWGHKPKTSRLVHGAGIVSMGYVMEYLVARFGCFNPEHFVPYLERLAPYTAWTEGYWQVTGETLWEWNAVQNIPRHYTQLTHLLLDKLRSEIKRLTLPIGATDN